MKQFSTYLSLFCLILIGILFYLWFKHTDELKKISAREKKTPDSAFRIAYFDLDSLAAHYNYYMDAQQKAKDRENEMNARLGAKYRAIQKAVADFQQKGNNVTPAESEEMNRQYEFMEQQYARTKDSLQQVLLQSNEELRTRVRKSIEDYVKEYNKDKRYAYIFAYDPSSYMYYRDTLYNITSDLVDGLNQAYDKQHH